MKAKKKRKNKSLIKKVEDLLFQEYGARKKAEQVALKLLFLIVKEMEKSLKKLDLTSKKKVLQ